MKKLKIFLYIIFFAIVLRSGIMEIIDSFNANCDTYKTFLQFSYEGIIIQKYIDSNEHSMRTVEIQNFKDSVVQKLTLDFDKTGFFNRIRVGDTIYKKFNSDTVYLSNKGTKDLYIINFGCKEKT